MDDEDMISPVDTYDEVIHALNEYAKSISAIQPAATMARIAADEASKHKPVEMLAGRIQDENYHETVCDDCGWEWPCDDFKVFVRALESLS